MEETKKSRKKYTMTEAALAAHRANIRKAHAAPKEKIHRATEKRQAASRANMEKAIAARNSPEGIIAARLNAATHGLFIKDLAGSFKRMGEDPQEYQTLLRLFQGIFVPQDEVEQEYVRRLTEASWKRLRLFRAQAVWELQRLKEVLEGIDTSRPLTAQETHRRAAMLFMVFDYYIDYIDLIEKHKKQIQKYIHKIIIKRSQGAMDFKVIPRMTSIRQELDNLDLPLDEFLDLQLKDIDKRLAKIDKLKKARKG